MRRILLAVATVTIAVAFVAALVAVGGSAAPAYAGGANLFPVQDRYEPGDIATLVGYVSPSSAGGWIADAPYSTFAVSPSGERVALGTVAFEPAPAAGAGPGTLRVTLTFPVPDDLGAGRYELRTCNEGCAKGFGDLAGGALNIGVDPVQPLVREWPPAEPEIVNLPHGARTTWPVTPPQTQASTTRTVAAAAPTLPRPAPAPQPTSHDASPAALALGGTLAALCVALVLVALREG